MIIYPAKVSASWLLLETTGSWIKCLIIFKKDSLLVVERIEVGH